MIKVSPLPAFTLQLRTFSAFASLSDGDGGRERKGGQQRGSRRLRPHLAGETSLAPLNAHQVGCLGSFSSTHPGITCEYFSSNLKTNNEVAPSLYVTGPFEGIIL